MRSTAKRGPWERMIKGTWKKEHKTFACIDAALTFLRKDYVYRRWDGDGKSLIFPLNWGCFPPCISVYICAILPLNIDISSQKLEKTDVLNMARIVAYLFISMKILHILRHDQEVPLSGVCR